MCTQDRRDGKYGRKAEQKDRAIEKEKGRKK